MTLVITPRCKVCGMSRREITSGNYSCQYGRRHTFKDKKIPMEESNRVLAMKHLQKRKDHLVLTIGYCKSNIVSYQRAEGSKAHEYYQGRIEETTANMNMFEEEVTEIDQVLSELTTK